MPFASAKEAITDALAGCEYRKSENNRFYLGLDGVWKFKLLDNPAKDDQSWVKTESEKDLSGWNNINVPGTWSRQGGDAHFENCFDMPHYTNVQMPFENTPPKPPEKNSTGLYWRTFTVPESWKNRRVVLHVGSAESVPFVFINGNFDGLGKDTRLPSEFDITSFLKEGTNTIGIKVVRYSDASFIEDQDQWWLGGIHRSVYLYSTEDCFIKDIKALPGSADGIIDLAVTLGGKLPESSGFGNESKTAKSKEKPFTIKYNLHPFTLVNDLGEAEKTGAQLAAKSGLVSGEMELLPNYRINADTVSAKLTLENPLLWSHEHPNLYILSVELYRDGRFIESTAFCTGFRSIKIENRMLLINGKMVYIKGANRHEHDEKTGKTQSVETMLKDIKILKSHNFNAVRTSHYPDDERWYELCNRYGIYLWDEADIESHCFYSQLCDDTRWLAAMVTRIRRMAERDKNHPSVITWSLGNESGWGAAHDAGSAWVHAYDSTRPVHYEGVLGGSRIKGLPVLDRYASGKHVTDIVCPMYPSLETISDFVNYRDDHRPLIMCEYSHAMGNSNGSLEDYWKLIESKHGLQGGFIWEWIDHGFEAFTKDGKKYWKYGGDFGDTPSDFDFVCDGLLWPDQTPKPAMEECKQLFAPVRLTPLPLKALHFTLENRYDFSSLDNLILNWSICEDEPGKTAEKILLEGKLNLPPLNPGEKTEINFENEKLVIPANSGAVYFHGEFVLKDDTPWAKAGHIVARAESILKESTNIVIESSAAKSEVAGCDIAKIAALFKPSLYRVPTQNDGLKTALAFVDNPEAEFYFKGKAFFPWIRLDLLHHKTADEKTENVIWEGRQAERYSAVILAGENAHQEYKQFTSGKGMGTFSLTTVKPEKPGHPLTMEVIFDLDRNLPELPRIGICAKIPACYEKISWFGSGPFESYPDRLAAAFLGRYTNKIDELEVPYVVPQENGNRSGVRNFSLTAPNATSGTAQQINFFADKPVNFSCSRYTLSNMWEAKHTCDLVDTTQGTGGYFNLYIDIAQRGVGTATCGPDTRMEYRVKPGLFRMKLFIV